MNLLNRFTAWWRTLRPWEQCALGFGAAWLALEYGAPHLKHMPGGTLVYLAFIVLGVCCFFRMAHDTCLYMLEALNAKHELDRLKSLSPSEAAAYLEHRRVQEILSLPPEERTRRYPEEMRAASELARVLSPEQMLELLERSNAGPLHHESRTGTGSSLRSGAG